jgi:hypothetical protein
MTILTEYFQKMENKIIEISILLVSGVSVFYQRVAKRSYLERVWD